MLYEFIATITAGFAMAGIALLLNHLAKIFKKSTPKWLVPVFAGLGMIGFQVYQEYSWYGLQTSQLADGVEVVKTIEKSTWYRPWSYIKPQVVRFMAVDSRQTQTNQKNPHWHLATLYLFERRMSTKVMPQIIDCEKKARADFVIETQNSTSMDNQNIQWVSLTENDPLLKSVCH